MTLVLILAVLAMVALACVYGLVRGHARALRRLEDPEHALEGIDIEAFLTLIDGDDREFLRERLTAGDFRRVQRQRARAALEYVGRIARNAALLLRLGEATREDPDPEVADVGRELADLALKVRLNALSVSARLYLLLLFPTGAQHFGQVLFHYRSLTDAALRLSRLQQPAAAEIRIHSAG